MYCAGIGLLTLLLLLGGCASAERRQSLSDTLWAYANIVRWDGFSRAWQFVDPKVRAMHTLSALDKARFQQVQIGGYDEGDGPIFRSQNCVTQEVNIDLINRHSQSERRIIDHQIWHYDKRAKRWWLESGLPHIEY